MALTRNKPRNYTAPTLGSLPLSATTLVYEGAAIGIDASTGKARSVVAGDLFAGFARWQVSSIRDAAGATPTSVNLVAAGEVTLAVTGVVSTSVGASVFASDDDTFALTGTTVVGTIVRVPSAGQAVVAFRAGVPALSSAQVTALQALLEEGTVTVFRASVVPTLGGSSTPSVTMNAGSGNTISGARVNINPDTDTIGAQRLLTVTDETVAISALNRTLVLESSVAITALHLVGLSSSTTYTGAAYVIGTAETDLADAVANDARFEFSSGDDVRTVVIVLQQGSTAQTALCQVTGYSHA